ncbi:hypothetical protein FHS42_001160 [Streptomyces zagrosensis]|uniref:Uncharacterized protein n=1 Tax=Streptomyces zagrosensis TaxID=1042984 RepID=A0A7W9Q675_9ACTN|nr:hypothetical protein [Streptomyces zagrosensis]
MTGAILWRTPEKLCTARGTVLWTSPRVSRCHGPDLGFLYLRAVQKKNFPTRPKIATNGAEKTTQSDQR